MSDYAVLLLVLAGIYLIECVAWVPSIAFAYRAPTRRPWIPARELGTVLGEGWRAVFAGIVPGDGGVAVAEGRPLPLTPFGVCVCSESDGARAPVAWVSLGTVRADGRAVYLGRRILFRAPTQGRARQLSTLMHELATASPDVRDARIEMELGRSLDARAARRTLRRYRWCVRPLGWQVRLLAAAMFLGLPMAMVAGGPRGALSAAAITMGLVGLVAWTFVARIRRMGLSGVSSSHATIMVLTPPAALRAVDFVSRESFGGHHALALARAAGTDTYSRALASQMLREIRHPLEHERVPCCEAASWTTTRWRDTLEDWARREFQDLEGLLTPPARLSGTLHAYCPRCHAQFASPEATCPDCTGLPLERW